MLRECRLHDVTAQPEATLILTTEPIVSIRRAPALIDAVARAGGDPDAPAPWPPTTDDCGLSSFSGDSSTPRDATFAKIPARLRDTALASAQLGGA